MNTAFTEIDVHGMTRTQAKTALQAALRRASPGTYRIRVIHGYHGGTGLRDLVRREIARDPKILRTEIGLNPGQTDLILREL